MGKIDITYSINPSQKTTYTDISLITEIKRNGFGISDKTGQTPYIIFGDIKYNIEKIVHQLDSHNFIISETSLDKYNMKFAEKREFPKDVDNALYISIAQDAIIGLNNTGSDNKTADKYFLVLSATITKPKVDEDLEKRLMEADIKGCNKEILQLIGHKLSAGK